VGTGKVNPKECSDKIVVSNNQVMTLQRTDTGQVFHAAHSGVGNLKSFNGYPFGFNRKHFRLVFTIYNWFALSKQNNRFCDADISFAIPSVFYKNGVARVGEFDGGFDTTDLSVLRYHNFVCRSRKKHQNQYAL